ncbi:MAG: zinc-ribbon domain-containing protein [Acutalibacteraceae bacterium]|nr:zinc-ribbon domain-containing protein [Acutalibacteraceae bacterium]
MKFCEKCGKELVDEAVFCPGCGCAVASKKANGGNDGLATAAKVFLILGCIAQGWMLIPLAWCLPITISIFNRMKRNEPVGVGLKVCSLLFVSLVGGILLLCRSDD